MAVGRITGPLLKANLLRDGVDLAFETDLLYLNVVDGKVGIKTSSPSTDLHVNGTTRTTTIEVTTQAKIASFTIGNTNTISSTSSTINFVPSGTNAVVYQGKIVTGDLQVSGNTIEVTASDVDLDIDTIGTGKINVNSSMQVNGDLHVTGNFQVDGDAAGTINIGDSNTDNVVFNADINSHIIPNTDNTFDLGSDPTSPTNGQAWRNLYTHTLVSTNVSITDLTVSNDLEVNGSSTFKGDVQIGDATTDIVTFNSTISSNLIPTANQFYSLGTDTQRWDIGYFSRVEVDGVVIDNNQIATTTGNSDLTLTAAGSGKINIPNNDVQADQSVTVGQDLTVTSGTTYLKDTTIVGDITQTGDIHQTGDFTTSGTVEVTGNVTATNNLTVADITISGHTIEGTATDTDINLIPNGSGDVVFEDIRVTNNIFKSTQPNQDIILQPQGTGSVIISSDQSLIIPVGTDATRPASPVNGMIRYNTDRERYEGYFAQYSTWLQLSGVIDADGNTYITAESTPGANDNTLRFVIDSNLLAYMDATKLWTSRFETNDIAIYDNQITTVNTDTDINFTTTGTGGVKIGNLQIRNNTITNTASGAVTEFVETGTGYVKISGTYGVVIPSGDLAALPTNPETGMIRFNTYYSYVEVWDGSQWVNSAGTNSGITLSQATDIGIVSALLFG